MQIMVQDTHYFKQILVLFPGTTNSTVLFSAHFDSVPGSPGASDDGAAITVLLQLARLKSLSQTKSRNSFLLFFNNGEEIGLAGSEALLNSKNYTALVSNIKVFANFEGGGTGGKPILFRTTSSQLTQAYADLPYPHMSSFGGDLLGLLGSYTDYQNYVKAGIPGFDVAYYENRRFYHTPDDSLNNISPSDVQAMGSNALALSKTLLNAEWIDNLKIESKNAFYDHFGGYYPVLISPTFQWSLACVLILFFIASLVYGYFYLYVPFKIPDSLVDPSIKSKKTYFGAHLLIFAFQYYSLGRQR
ncbi:Zn-dependent exopeptidase [Rhizoclosmatium globosum]|uniref:Peptide hydrolase n=1 Tax=Rhizoclosmatium globosum TaxID=329046 RepID=A0A1Y2CBA6_9FUNG|nr:Zn-dependent exopeptidase [Rhizoclosmatium globosum]|eukprot:ORY44320.1 Zn-dependent exopeptidase [Rhizoclosmatium globosum]